MNLKKIIPISLLLIPIIEIILFIEIGSMIGSFNTILTIFGTALLEFILLNIMLRRICLKFVAS